MDGVQVYNRVLIWFLGRLKVKWMEYEFHFQLNSLYGPRIRAHYGHVGMFDSVFFLTSFSENLAMRRI
jgi:hypothetical protein